MTEVETQTTGLTKTDIAALRKADEVYANFYEGEHSLRCVKRATWQAREKDPYLQDIHYDVTVKGNVTNYAKGEETGYVKRCFTNVWHSTGVWQIVRPGDEIFLAWVRDNSSDITRKADLHVDQLTIEVHRGNRRMRFLAESQVCPANSARMTLGSKEGCYR